MFKQIDLRVVLVRPIYERNIGATSRAMSNMGIDQLILIAPQCQITIEAHRAAANGQFPLENRKVYPSWDEFYKNEPSGLQIATTARDGRGRQVQDFETVLRSIKSDWEKELNSNSPLETNPQKSSSDKENSDEFNTQNSESKKVIHILFGPEDWGLSTDDIQYSNYCCSIPTYGENSSLNLAQAVLLVLFTYRQVFGGEKTKLDGQQKSPTIKKLETLQIFPEKTLKTWLETMNIDITTRKMNAYSVLKKMLLKNTPTEKEYRILEMALQQSIRKMKKSTLDHKD